MNHKWVHFLGCALLLVFNAEATVYYVSMDATHVPPFSSWMTAATNIDAAVKLARDDDTVLVAPGRYSITNEIVITNAVTVEAVEGPAETIIDGMNMTRCVFMETTNAVIRGFTLTRGNAIGARRNYEGGAIFCNLGARIENCIVVSNSYVTSGAGAAFIGMGSVIDGCIISHNNSGGGGGLYITNATARNCLISYNSADHGGGVMLLGGGQHLVENCTIVYNTASNSGGGIYFLQPNCEVRNSIIFHNYALTGSNYYYHNNQNHSVWYSCTAPPPTGISNVTGTISLDPMFVDVTNGNFRLRANSPAIDTGLKLSVDEQYLDLDKKNRVLGSSIDIGAFEAGFDAMAVSATGSYWQAVPGAMWQAQFCSSHTMDVWTNVGSVQTATLDYIELPIGPMQDAAGFYRIVWILDP